MENNTNSIVYNLLILLSEQLMYDISDNEYIDFIERETGLSRGDYNKIMRL